MIRSTKEELLSIESFFKISTLFLLINMSVIGRLHMFDSNTENAEGYFHSEILAEAKTHKLGQMSVLQQLEVFLTQIDSETIYLLPFIFELSTLLLLFFKGILDNLFLTLIISIITNFLCFLSLALKSDNFFIYRTTYIMQALFIFPQVIFSSFGLTKIMPKKIRNFKGLYATIMFLLPNFAIPISYWVFHDRNEHQAIQRGILKCSIFATVLSVFAFFLLFQNRVKITFILDQVLVGALDRLSIQSEEQIFDRQMIKKKLKTAPQLKEQFKVFEQKVMKGNDSKKKQHKRIPHSNLSSIIMLLGLIISMGSQLQEIEKQIYLSIRVPQQQFQIQQVQNHSSLHKFYSILISTFLALTALILIQNWNMPPLSISIYLIISGFCSVMVVFCILNNLLPLSIFLISMSTILAKAFFSSIIIPSIIFIQNAGIDTLDCLKILFLINWALQLLLRIVFSMLKADIQIFLLSFLVIISCFYIQKYSKQVIREMEEDESNYAKIGEEFDQENDDWVEEEEKQQQKINKKAIQESRENGEDLNTVILKQKGEKNQNIDQVEVVKKLEDQQSQEQIELKKTVENKKIEVLNEEKEYHSPSKGTHKKIRIESNIFNRLKKDGNKQPFKGQMLQQPN